VTFIATPPIAQNGQCCEMTFPATPPTSPSCTFVSNGATLRCK
jgi:hypothetical protein